jgi:hypothetical protein
VKVRLGVGSRLLGSSEGLFGEPARKEAPARQKPRRAALAGKRKGKGERKGAKAEGKPSRSRGKFKPGRRGR